MDSFHLSFELYPPKTDAGLDKLIESAKALSELQPEFFSITFGAGGQGCQKTQLIADELSRLNIRTAPHMICVGENQLTIQDKLNRYHALGISNFVLIRGDAKFQDEPPAFPYAAKLVDFVRSKSPDAKLYVSCYPEVHPETKTLAHEIQYLKSKIDVGANAAFSQLFFNTDAYGYFLDALEKANIDIPIIPGIMGIQNPEGLAAFCKSCQAELPQWLRHRLASYQDMKSQKAFIEDFLTHFCERLIELGAPGLHMYTLNQVEPCKTIINRLNLKQHERQTHIHSSKS